MQVCQLPVGKAFFEAREKEESKSHFKSLLVKPYLDGGKIKNIQYCKFANPKEIWSRNSVQRCVTNRMEGVETVIGNEAAYSIYTIFKLFHAFANNKTSNLSINCLESYLQSSLTHLFKNKQQIQQQMKSTITRYPVQKQGLYWMILLKNGLKWQGYRKGVPQSWTAFAV